MLGATPCAFWKPYVICFYCLSENECYHFDTPLNRDFVKSCKKDQLIEIANHYGIAVAENCHKEELVKTILPSLFDRRVLHKGELGWNPHPSMLVSAPAAMQTAGLTFEQQKELLVLQFEQEELCKCLDRVEKLELERLRQDTERMRFETEEVVVPGGEVPSWRTWCGQWV